MTERAATVDKATNPPMQYIVAGTCPKKLLEGKTFYACACYGPAVPGQDKPAMQATCDHLRDARVLTDGVIQCAYGEGVAGGGAEFGIPIVRHAAQQEDCGSRPD